MRSDEVYSFMVSPFVASAVFELCMQMIPENSCRCGRNVMIVWISTVNVKWGILGLLSYMDLQNKVTNNCLSASTCTDEPPIPCLNCCTEGKFETLSVECGRQNWIWEIRVGKLVYGYVYTIVSGLTETPKWIWLWQALLILEAL